MRLEIQKDEFHLMNLAFSKGQIGEKSNSKGLVSFIPVALFEKPDAKSNLLSLEKLKQAAIA